MTLHAYRFKVQLLEGQMNHMRKLAEIHGNWDDYHWAKRKFQNAAAYLRKKEKKEAAA